MSCRMIGAIDDDDDDDDSSPGRVAIGGARSSSTVPSPRHTPTGSDMVPRGNLTETQTSLKDQEAFLCAEMSRYLTLCETTEKHSR